MIPMGTATPKPEKGSAADGRRFARAQRRATLAQQAARDAREAAKVWQGQRRAAWLRDGGRCRAFGTPLRLRSADPLNLAHTHHMVYRSAGGSDDLANLITLSPVAHDAEHRHALRITGDPNGTLTFTRIDLDTGTVRNIWESSAARGPR